MEGTVMSITTHQSNIKRAKTKITELRKKLSKEQEDQAKNMKAALRLKKEISNTKSQTMIRSKLSKFDRLQKDLEGNSKELGSINKKITEEEKRLHRYEEQLLRIETRELKKAIDERIQIDRETSQSQQTLLEELNQIKSSIAIHTEELANTSGDQEQYDVFISHSSLDKEDFVKPLAEILKAFDVKVWYDEYKLTWGKHTRRTIDTGLGNCRFGIVVFSENFFNGRWTQHELDGLVSRHLSEHQDLILPIWHNVGYEEVRQFSPTLADITALKSEDMNIEEIAEQLITLLKESSFDEEE